MRIKSLTQTWFAALLFATSTPSRVRESLHLGKHCQQRFSSRNYNSVRWGDYLIYTLICASVPLFTLCLNSGPRSYPSALSADSVYEMKSILPAHLFPFFVCVSDILRWWRWCCSTFCIQVWLGLSWPALMSVFSSRLTPETPGERYSMVIVWLGLAVNVVILYATCISATLFCWIQTYFSTKLCHPLSKTERTYLKW